MIAGTGYVRDREHEFTDPEQYPARRGPGEVPRGGRTWSSRTIESQDDAGFVTPVAAQPPIQTRLGLFLVCAAHLNNHIGQMSYLVQALAVEHERAAGLVAARTRSDRPGSSLSA